MHFDIVLPYIGVLITKYHADSDPSSSQPASPADSEASLRAELAERISGAQAEIEHHLTELRRAASAGGDATPLLQAEAQLQGLSRLQHRVASAHGASLASIRAEVTASIAATQLFAQQARAAVATADMAEVALHAASAAARQEVTSFVHDFYEKKIFDPYLRFGSAEDEEAYRKREAERREAIDKALAEGTPEGNLRAAELSLEQMDDAKRFGAGDSPEFRARYDRLKGATSELSTASAAVGTRAVDATARGNVDPLDAVQPQETDETRLVLARFKATGIVVSETDHANHGLSQTETPTKTTGVRLS